VFGILSLECVKQQILVVAAEANNLVRRPFLQVNQKIDDAATVGASIDIIADEDEL
jgi:hypothetical protein